MNRSNRRDTELIINPYRCLSCINPWFSSSKSVGFSSDVKLPSGSLCHSYFQTIKIMRWIIVNHLYFIYISWLMFHGKLLNLPETSNFQSSRNSTSPQPGPLRHEPLAIPIQAHELRFVCRQNGLRPESWRNCRGIWGIRPKQTGQISPEKNLNSSAKSGPNKF